MTTNVRFDTRIETLLQNNKCDNIEDLPLSAIKDEINDVKAGIENEKLWEMDAPTLDESDMHRDNIISMQEYLVYLQELESKKDNHAQVENKYNPNGKDIRFINSNYEDLFKIPDRGYITITLDNGEQSIYKCVFIDEYHTTIGNNTFHICEFAEKMEKIACKYEPCPTPEKIAGYMITNRTPVNNKEVVMAHNPRAASPWVTWVRHLDFPDYETGHYWDKQSKARTDYMLRAEAERTGKVYDHTTLYNGKSNREVNIR